MNPVSHLIVSLFLCFASSSALTEKIVAALPRMKCPHRIEPHQIQGLDYIHIFPVIQWLVKRVIETRAEMGDYIRKYSESQFNKHRQLPQDIEFDTRKPSAMSAVSTVKVKGGCDLRVDTYTRI